MDGTELDGSGAPAPQRCCRAPTAAAAAAGGGGDSPEPGEATGEAGASAAMEEPTGKPASPGAAAASAVPPAAAAEELKKQQQGVKRHHHKHNLKHRYELQETLGKGTYGKVKRAVERFSGRVVRTAALGDAARHSGRRQGIRWSFRPNCLSPCPRGFPPGMPQPPSLFLKPPHLPSRRKVSQLGLAPPLSAPGSSCQFGMAVQLGGGGLFVKLRTAPESSPSLWTQRFL